VKSNHELFKRNKIAIAVVVLKRKREITTTCIPTFFVGMTIGKKIKINFRVRRSEKYF